MTSPFSNNDRQPLTIDSYKLSVSDTGLVLVVDLWDLRGLSYEGVVDSFPGTAVWETWQPSSHLQRDTTWITQTHTIYHHAASRNYLKQLNKLSAPTNVHLHWNIFIVHLAWIPIKKRHTKCVLNGRLHICMCHIQFCQICTSKLGLVNTQRRLYKNLK